MTEKQTENNYCELLRYPVVTICIVAGLFLVSLFLGIDFSKVSKISTEGIEFDKRQAEASAQIMTQLTSKVDYMEKQLDKIPPVFFEGSNDLLGSSAEPLTDTVSETVSRLSYINTDKDTFLKGRKGYILLGVYEPETKVWETALPIRLTDTKEVIKDNPNNIALRRYETNANIMLRSQPDIENNPIGALPRLLPILLLSIEKGSDNQYWAKIEVEK